MKLLDDVSTIPTWEKSESIDGGGIAVLFDGAVFVNTCFGAVWAVSGNCESETVLISLACVNVVESRRCA